MSRKKFAYTGCDNLEVMSEAVKYNNFLISLITSRVRNLKDKKILDFGAGSGTYADLLKESGIAVDCLEPDSTLQKALGGKGYNVLSDAKELKPASYDVIYALNVLEHIDDDGAMILTLSKALKKNGKLIIYVPAFQTLFTAMDKKVGHFRRYRKTRLRNFANKAGLRIVRLDYCDPIGFVAAFTYKMIGNKQGDLSPASIKFYDRFIFPLSKGIQPLFRSLFGKNVVLVAKNGKK